MKHITDKIKPISRLKAPKNVFALSFDGGALRGISAMVVLEYICKQLGTEIIPNLFDVQVGVSTGSVILAGLNTVNPDKKGYITPTEAIKAYKDLGLSVFNDRKFTRGFQGKIESILNRGHLNGPPHCSKNKLQLLKNFMSNPRIGEISPDTKLFIPLLDLNSSKIDLFSNHFKNDHKHSLIDIVSFATTSIPYFAPHCTIQKKINPKAIYYDFGFASNSPSVLTYIITKKLYPKANIYLLSLGNGIIKHEKKCETIENWGFKEWLIKESFSSIFLHGGSNYTKFLTQFLEDIDPKLNYYPIDMETTKKEPFTHSFTNKPKAFDIMMEHGHEMIQENEKILDQFIKALKKNRKTS